MNRKKFIKSSILALGGLFLISKDILSTENKAFKSFDLNDNKIPDSFIKFAKKFTENYKQLSLGTFLSDCGEYRIDYLKTVRNINNEFVINSVSHKTGFILLNKSRLVNKPPSFVFNIIIWSYIASKKDLPLNHSEVDKESLEYTLKNGYSKKELASSFLDFLRGNHSDYNKKRVSVLINFIKKNDNKI